MNRRFQVLRQRNLRNYIVFIGFVRSYSDDICLQYDIQRRSILYCVFNVNLCERFAFIGNQLTGIVVINKINQFFCIGKALVDAAYYSAAQNDTDKV